VKEVSLNFFCKWESQKKRCWACGSLEVIRWGIRDKSNDLNVKTAGFYLLEMLQINAKRIDLFGSKNGF
jgi:hypothetical protein